MYLDTPTITVQSREIYLNKFIQALGTEKSEDHLCTYVLEKVLSKIAG